MNFKNLCVKIDVIVCAQIVCFYSSPAKQPTQVNKQQNLFCTIYITMQYCLLCAHCVLCCYIDLYCVALSGNDQPKLNADSR